MIPSFFKIRFVLLIAGFLCIFFLLGAGRFAFADVDVLGHSTGDIITVHGLKYELEDLQNQASVACRENALWTQNGGFDSVTNWIKYNSTVFIYSRQLECDPGWTRQQLAWTASLYVSDDPLDTDDDLDGFTEKDRKSVV